MNRRLVLILGLLITSAPAWASKQKRIKKTGIESFDDVFTQVADIDDRVRSARKARRSARTAVDTALGLPEGTPFKDAIADLKDRAGDKIQLTLDGKTPKLSAKDAVPSNVQQAIDAVNTAMDDYGTAVDELQGVPKTVKKLSKQMETFPKQFKQEAGGFKITEIKKRYKQLKKVKNNIKITTEIPDRSKKLTKGLKSDIGAVTSSFVQVADGSSSGGSSSGGAKGGTTTPSGDGGASTPAGGGRTKRH